MRAPAAAPAPAPSLLASRHALAFDDLERERIGGEDVDTYVSTARGRPFAGSRCDFYQGCGLRCEEYAFLW